MNCILTSPHPHPKSTCTLLGDESRLRRPSADELLSLMTTINLGPYRSFSSRVEGATLRRWRGEVSEVLAAQHCVALERGGSLVAAAAWTLQEWDSTKLRTQVAKLDLLGAVGGYPDSHSAMFALLQAVLPACDRAGLRYLTTRADAADLATIHALQDIRFALVDGIQTYILDIADRATLSRGRPVGLEIGLYEDAQQDQIVEIAKSAYQFDRFHSDPALDSDLADSLHADWLRNSCEGSAADAVVTARRRDEVLGYVTLRFDRQLEAIGGPKVATIVLVAVKESGQGGGIGRYMTEWTIDWLRSIGMAVVQVGTQLTNVPAARLYQSVGFRYAGSSFTFRRLL